MSAIAARTAQQSPIAAAYELQTVAGEADGGFSDRISDPACGAVLVFREEVTGDDAICGAGLPRVHRAEHLSRALAPLRRHARIGWDVLAEHGVPQARNGGQSIRRQFVKDDQGAEGTGFIELGDGDIVRIAADLNPDQTGIGFEDRAGLQIVKADADIARRSWSGNEGNRRWIGLRGPEDRLDER